MTVLYREFLMRAPTVGQNLVAFLKANAGSYAERGEPLRVIVTAEEKQRNAQQNHFYWGGILKQVAEQAWVDGRQFDKDAWHEYFARKFGVLDELVLPGGEIVTRRKSTAQMSIGEFAEYITQVQSYAGTELGVEFQA